MGNDYDEKVDLIIAVPPFAPNTSISELMYGKGDRLDAFLRCTQSVLTPDGTLALLTKFSDGEKVHEACRRANLYV